LKLALVSTVITVATFAVAVVSGCGIPGTISVIILVPPFVRIPATLSKFVKFTSLPAQLFILPTKPLVLLRNAPFTTVLSAPDQSTPKRAGRGANRDSGAGVTRLVADNRANASPESAARERTGLGSI
jgi:hypothetical protein